MSHVRSEQICSSNRSGGRTFGVSAFGSVAGIWYRRLELEVLGLEPPRTWEESFDELLSYTQLKNVHVAL